MIPGRHNGGLFILVEFPRLPSLQGYTVFMETITKAVLAALLNDIKGATFATLVTETDPKLKKTGNPFGKVRKVSRVNVCLGFQYENAVNRQRTREGSEPDFEVAPRQWGEKISAMLVSHNGKIYLETKVEKSLDTKYLAENGQEIPSDDVKPFLPARKPNARQETEKEILVRDYALDSITAISFQGKDYVVVA